MGNDFYLNDRYRYKVLLTDDEPESLMMLEMIINKKCPDFEIVGLAENGSQVIDILENCWVDVIVSDVMMPQMNGIELVQLVNEQYPHIMTVIVSGYQDFEYVQGALRAGVEDYILKPISPQKMTAMMGRIKERLDNSYYIQRNKFLQKLGSGSDPVSTDELYRLFSSEYYYVGIIRKNSVISRFHGKYDYEIFSGESEKIIIYGRDEQEMLYIYPEEIVVYDFEKLMKKVFRERKDENSFQTMVICRDKIERDRLAQSIHDIYQVLDNSIVIGYDQTLYLEDGIKMHEESERDKEAFRNVMYYVDKGDVYNIIANLEHLFRIYADCKYPQFILESKFRYLLLEMRNKHILKCWDEYWLDDCFVDISSIFELEENIIEIIKQNYEENPVGKGFDKESIYKQIIAHMSEHLSEDLAVQKVCLEVGISQATLGRLFRTYANESYKSCLTKMRIKKAVAYMEENPKEFVRNISERVGFNDQFYFSRVFKSVVGKSPTEYIEQLENNRHE